MSRRLNETIAERLARHSMPEPNSGCLLWTGAVASHGYGVFAYAGRYGLTAHRASWEVAHGPIPAGLFVLHKCDVRPCINPNHLFLGTHQDNMDDMQAKGRRSNVAPRGVHHRAAKLNEEQVREIRADNRTIRSIAAAYGVDRTLISRIKRRQLWKHLSVSDSATPAMEGR